MSVGFLNGNFESGSIYPWVPSAPSAAVAIQSNAQFTAPEGQFYLDIQTDYGNRGNSVEQHITGLVPGTEYTFSVQARSGSSSTANYCYASLTVGADDTTSTSIRNDQLPDEWVLLSGTHVATSAEEVIDLAGGCNFSGSSARGHVLFDEVIFVEA
ncbi:hypothetical protein BJX70DRAFT_12587 [Aspergillus crustosus]